MNGLNEFPVVTIKSGVETREVNGKNGLRKVIFQRAQLETQALRIQLEVEIDNPTDARPVGSVYRWDVVADLTPGRFGCELARRMTLVPEAAAQAKPKAA